MCTHKQVFKLLYFVSGGWVHATCCMCNSTYFHVNLHLPKNKNNSRKCALFLCLVYSFVSIFQKLFLFLFHFLYSSTIEIALWPFLLDLCLAFTYSFSHFAVKHTCTRMFNYRFVFAKRFSYYYW